MTNHQRCTLRVDFVEGDHVHCSLFMNGGKCGDLVFRVGEWQIFGAALLLGGNATHGQLDVTSDNAVFLKWRDEQAAIDKAAP